MLTHHGYYDISKDDWAEQQPKDDISTAVEAADFRHLPDILEERVPVIQGEENEYCHEGIQQVPTGKGVPFPLLKQPCSDFNLFPFKC